MHLSYRLSGAKKIPVFSGFCKIYENHPWKRIFVGRDEIRGEESSLEEIFVGGVVLCVPITVLTASLLLRAPLKNKPDQ